MHTVPLLMDKISIQSTQLKKLGEEQVRDIQRLPGAKPCLVTAETRQKNPALLEQIRGLDFTHIVMGPEQLLSPKFRDVAAVADRATVFQGEREGRLEVQDCLRPSKAD